MNCNEAQPLLGAYVDGELELSSTLALETHARACEPCRARIDSLRTLSHAVQRQEHYYTASAATKLRIQAALRAQESRGRLRIFPRSTYGLVPALAGAAAMALFVWTMGWRPMGHGVATLSDEVIADHVRSLMANHLMDVASTDRHTVKPWFAGKLDFAPPVKDFAADGFPLIGGRIDYLGGRPVAALIYQRRAHMINVFIMPKPVSDGSAVSVLQEEGYSLYRWPVSADLEAWAVSDAGPAELEQLVKLWQRPD